MAKPVAPRRGVVPKAVGDACDDDKLRQNAVRDIGGVDETEPVD